MNMRREASIAFNLGQTHTPYCLGARISFWASHRASFVGEKINGGKICGREDVGRCPHIVSCKFVGWAVQEHIWPCILRKVFLESIKTVFQEFAVGKHLLTQCANLQEKYSRQIFKNILIFNIYLITWDISARSLNMHLWLILCMKVTAWRSRGKSDCIVKTTLIRLWCECLDIRSRQSRFPSTSV